MPQSPPEPAPASTATSYAAAGVSIEAADKAIELMKGWVEKARRPEVIGGIGGFAGLFDASVLTRYERPLLATSTDGVGTKVAIAQAMDVHDTIGFDLVGMVVDDLVVCGAEPLFMTDYIATGRVVPERIAAIVKGIAEACVEAGCALIGGETAEHPGLLGPDDYDVAGATTGVVEADRLLGPGRVRPGDVLVAMEASGLHSNGYSLVRHVLLETARVVAGPPRGGARAPARRGAPRAHPDLRHRLPGPGAADRRPRHGARHRRWSRGQPRAGAAGRGLRRRRPVDVDTPAGLRRRTTRGWRRAGRARGDPQLRGRHGRPHPRPTTSSARSTCSRATGSAPGPAGEVRADSDGGGRVSLVGQHPGW